MQAVNYRRDRSRSVVPRRTDRVERTLKILSALCVIAWLPWLAPTAALADAGFNPTDSGDVAAGQLMLRSGGQFTAAPNLSTRIDIDVAGIVARVSVSQEFRHDGTDWVEGVYVFPLPDEAAVDRLRMRIGERTIVGEIQERERARRIYAKAKSQGQRAGLVEQERPNLFTTSVANIGPGRTIRIEIAYQQTVAFDWGVFRLRIPLTLTPRYIPGAPLEAEADPHGHASATHEVPDAPRVTPPAARASLTNHRAAISARLDAGFPLARVDSRYHRVVTARVDGVYEVELRDGLVPLDRDYELEWTPQIGHETGAAVFTQTVGTELYTLFMLVPPAAPDRVVRRPRELILVIDTSGSMHGMSIEQARGAVAYALDRLEAQDLFNVIQFSSWTNQLFERSLPASGEHLHRARRFVAGLEATGGTEMVSAILAAFDSPPARGYLRQVIFITDGAIGNEEQLFGLIEDRIGPARMFTVGIGSAPNGYFMRKAARYGRGTYTYIGAASKVRESMQALFRKLENPVLTDIRVDWPAVENAEIFPDRIPDLYSGEPVLIAARTVSLPDVVNLTGSTGQGYWLRQVPIEPREQTGIAELWARRKIESLMDAQRAGAPADTVRQAVLEVALRHHLVTRYTSLVAVDRTPARPAYESLREARVPGTLPQGQTGWAATVGMPRTGTASRLHLRAGLAFLLLSLLLFGLSRSRDLRCA